MKTKKSMEIPEEICNNNVLITSLMILKTTAKNFNKE